MPGGSGGILSVARPPGRSLRTVARDEDRIALRRSLCRRCPLAAAAQTLPRRPPASGRRSGRWTRSRVARRARGLDQALVLPERPGQNQVAWYDFDWQYVDVPPPGGGKGGIRLYYYRNEVAQARRALPAIQSAFARLVDQFHYNPTKRIPYILFATQREFQTQNVFQVTRVGPRRDLARGPQDGGPVLRRSLEVRRGLDARDGAPVHHPEAARGGGRGGHARRPSTFLPALVHRGHRRVLLEGRDRHRDRPVPARPRLEPRSVEGATRSCRSPRTGSAATSRPTSSARRASRSSRTTYGKEKIQAFLENAYLLAEGDRQRAAVAGPQLRRARAARAERAARAGGRPLARVAQAPLLPGVPAREAGPPAAPRDPRASRTSRRTSSPRRTATSLVVRGIDREPRARAPLPRRPAEPEGRGRDRGGQRARASSRSTPSSTRSRRSARDVVVFAAQDGIGDRLYVRAVPPRHARGPAPARLRSGRRRTLDVRAARRRPLHPGVRPGALAGRAGARLRRRRARTGSRTSTSSRSRAARRGGSRTTPTPRRISPGGRTASTSRPTRPTTGGRTCSGSRPRPASASRLTTAPDLGPSPVGAPGRLGPLLVRRGREARPLPPEGRRDEADHRLHDRPRRARRSRRRGVACTRAPSTAATFRLVEVPKVAWLESPPVTVPPPAGEVLEIPTADLPQDAAGVRRALACKNWKPGGGVRLRRRRGERGRRPRGGAVLGHAPRPRPLPRPLGATARSTTPRGSSCTRTAPSGSAGSSAASTSCSRTSTSSTRASPTTSATSAIARSAALSARPLPARRGRADARGRRSATASTDFIRPTSTLRCGPASRPRTPNSPSTRTPARGSAGTAA